MHIFRRPKPVSFLLAILVFAPLTLAHAQGIDNLDRAIGEALGQTIARASMSSAEAKSLSVAAARTVAMPDLGTTAYTVKILDNQADAIYTYWYDASLQPTTEFAAFSQRAVAYEQTYGRLSRELYRRLNGSPAAQTASVAVAVWGEEPPPGTPAAGGPFRRYLPLVRGGAGSAVERILALLARRGYSADHVAELAPVVYATLPASVINELQAQPFVAAIYSQSATQPMLDSAVRSAAAPWTWERGITGASTKVAVLEDDGVAFANPYLNGSQYHIGWWTRVGSHATQVAGVVASDHGAYRGAAYGAEIYSANALNGMEPAIVAAADWAAERVDIINASIGTDCSSREITSLDKYVDWLVWNKRKTVVVAAGNLLPACPSNHHVTSPGKAYNVITVGAKDDKNTATSEADTQDDQFSYFSLYVDPVTASENRLKPEVTATGQRIRSTGASSPWIEADEVAGTSFAAPIVSGQAALMMQRSSWLKFSPEAVKAGVMASARWTKLIDDVNPSKWASVDKMGVGAVDCTAADNSLINDRVREYYLHKHDFVDNHYDIAFDGLAGQRIRVIITWSSHPSRLILNWILHDRLESDFDLTVTAPNGQIFGSYADEANYEIVEFNAPQTGRYRARIHLSRWDDAQMEEKIGFAWYSGLPIP